MDIRRYREGDFQPLSRLYRDFFNEMRERQGRTRFRLGEEEAEETARESLSDGSSVMLAEEDGKPVGFARVQLWEGAYFVREVFVDRLLRRKGVGSRLLAGCEDLVRKGGETSVYLTVEPAHSASIEYLIHNGYDTLNVLELREDLDDGESPEGGGTLEILGHRLRLLKDRRDSRT